MQQDERLNKFGLPYVHPKVTTTNTEVILSFKTWSFYKGDLVEKSSVIEPGKPMLIRLEIAKKQALELAKMLQDGYMEGKPTDMGFLAAVKLGARKRIMVMGSRGKERYRSFINVFSEWITETNRVRLSIDKVSKKDVYAFLDWTMEKRGVGNRTRNNYLDNMRSCFNELCEREVLTINPAKTVRSLPESPTKYPFFTKKQQKKLETYLKQKNRNLYYFTRFIYYGFLRPAEIRRIQVKDINLESGIIMAWSHVTKNKKQLPVAINPDLREAITEMDLSEVPGHWYLFGPNWEPAPKPCTYRNKFSVEHANALKETNLYDGILDMYTWKHTGVCNAFDTGIDVVQIMHQCRHSSLDMTYKYMRSLGKVISLDLKTKRW